MSIRLSEQPMTWVCTGDSVTQAVYHTHGSRSWVEHLHERIRWQLDRLHDVVINTGMSGWTAPMVLERFDHLVARFSPDVVSISLGTNDAAVHMGVSLEEYRAAMTELVARSAALGAQVAVHTPAGIALSAVEGRPDLGAYAQVARQVAAAAGATLVDHAAHWPAAYAERSYGVTEPIGWLDDSIHPNAAGHRVMADLTLEAFGLGAYDERP